jgi:hypothetical protein
MTFIDKLRELHACSEAIVWAKNYPTLQAAWKACDRGDWMLWLAGGTVQPGSPEHKRVVFAACQCARLALPHVPATELRPLAAIETAERWTKGETSIEKVCAAADAAADAAAEAANYAAEAANYAAYYAAYFATYSAAEAANYAAEAANYAAEAATYYATLIACADIVRQHVTCPSL